jgi:hypothetical protein
MRSLVGAEGEPHLDFGAKWQIALFEDVFHRAEWIECENETEKWRILLKHNATHLDDVVMRFDRAEQRINQINH